MNRVVLVGRLAKDPELRVTQSGAGVCSFCVACDRRYKTDGERQADFINCVAWRQCGEFVAKYFKKGQRIAVEGRLQVRDWKDENGNKRYVTEVIADSAEFCQSKGEGNGQAVLPSAGSDSPAAPERDIEDFMPIDDDDFPF